MSPSFPRSLILASGSPRRSDLLQNAGLQFQTVIPDVDELLPGDLPPSQLAAENAERKALAVALNYPQSIVIGADTIVCLNDTVFGKPADSSHAKEILHQLSGKTHKVLTAVSILRQHPIPQSARLMEETSVTFRDLTPEEIDSYLAKVPVLDKAGAYAAQSQEGNLIQSIDGCKNNVIGLPVASLLDTIKKAFPDEFESLFSSSSPSACL